MKIDFFILTLLLILALSGFVYARVVELEIPINEGWNLIPISVFLELDDTSDIKHSDFSYGFVYDLDDKKYVYFWNGNDLTAESQEKYGSIQRDEEHWIQFSSGWFYAKRSGSIKITVLSIL